MKHSVHDLLVTQFTRSLKSLEGMLHKAQEFAKERGFDENLFLDLRLTPDMFPLVRQVQITTDTTKLATSRLTGKTAPVFEDNEKTMTELLGRVARTRKYLAEFKPEDYQAYENKMVQFPRRPGQALSGTDYLSTHTLPNFYFHLTTAYALLRSHGVKLGKADFLGEQPWQTVNP